MTEIVAFDLVVVGGGPAGSAAACAAARAGLSVALVDKAEFPRDKLCGGLLTERSRQVFQEIFGVAWPPELIHSTRTVRFLMAGSPLAEVSDHTDIHLTLRRVFDAHLLELARAAGATVWTGVAVESVDHGSGQVRLADGRRLGYGHLIGADGVNSRVAQGLFGEAFRKSKIGFGLEVEAPRAMLPGQDEAVEIDFAVAAWGYGWVFPKRDTFTIGVGGLHRRNPALREALAGYLRAKGLDPTRLKVKGQYIPFGDARATPGRGRVLLCGDAAGFVDPVTGEGIAYAMQSGALAAAAVVGARARGRPEAALADYRRAARGITGAIRQARGWRPFIFAGWARRPFARLFGRAALLQRGFLDIMAGTRDYDALPGLVFREAARAVARRAARRPKASRGPSA